MKEDVIVYCVCSSRPLSLMITVSHVFNGQRDGYTPAGRTHPGCLCQLAPHKLQTQMKAMLSTAALNLRL